LESSESLDSIQDGVKEEWEGVSVDETNTIVCRLGIVYSHSWLVSMPYEDRRKV